MFLNRGKSICKGPEVCKSLFKELKASEARGQWVEHGEGTSRAMYPQENLGVCSKSEGNYYTLSVGGVTCSDVHFLKITRAIVSAKNTQGSGKH